MFENSSEISHATICSAEIGQMNVNNYQFGKSPIISQPKIEQSKVEQYETNDNIVQHYQRIIQLQTQLKPEKAKKEKFPKRIPIAVQNVRLSKLHLWEWDNYASNNHAVDAVEFRKIETGGTILQGGKKRL